MKAFIQSFLLLLMVTIVRSTAMGMGYPQDMFAEHVTVKETSATVQKAKSKKMIKPTGQKAASVGQHACASSRVKSTPAACPKIQKNTIRRAGTHPGMAKSTPVATTVQRSEVVAVKTFNTEEDNVEETVVPLEDFLKSASTAPLLSHLIHWVWEGLTL